MKRMVVILFLAAILLAGCASDADVASANLSKEADMFKIDRRIVFINGITDKYLMVIEGKCSLGNNDTAQRMTVTCKVGENSYKKHFLGLSDNVTFISEQIDGVPVDVYNYKVIFKPESIVPDIQLEVR